MVATHDMTWEQGEDLTMNLVYKENNATVDLTGYEVRMDIAPVQGGPIVSLNSVDFTGTAEDGTPLDATGATDNEATLDAQGNIRIVVSRALTLPDGAVGKRLAASNQFVYDLFIRDKETGLQRKLLKGRITVNRSVTLWT